MKIINVATLLNNLNNLMTLMLAYIHNHFNMKIKSFEKQHVYNLTAQLCIWTHFIIQHAFLAILTPNPLHDKRSKFKVQYYEDVQGWNSTHSACNSAFFGGKSATCAKSDVIWNVWTLHRKSTHARCANIEKVLQMLSLYVRHLLILRFFVKSTLRESFLVLSQTLQANSSGMLR